MVEPWVINQNVDVNTYRRCLAKLRSYSKNNKVFYRVSLRYRSSGPIILDMKDHSIDPVSWGPELHYVEERWLDGSLHEIYIWCPIRETRAIFQFSQGRLKYWDEDYHHFSWVAEDVFTVSLIANFTSVTIECNTTNGNITMKRHGCAKTCVKGDKKMPHMKIGRCITFEAHTESRWYILAGSDIFKWFPQDISWVFSFSEITRADIGCRALVRIRMAMRLWLLRRQRKIIRQVYPLGVASIIHSYTVD